MQYYQEGCQGSLGWWRESQQPRLSLGEVGLLEGVVAVEPIDDLGIDFFFYPSSPSPFPGKWQGSPPEGIPFCWVLSTQKRGIQGSGMGHLASPGPQPQAQSKGLQEPFLVFISVVFQPAAQKDLSQK